MSKNILSVENIQKDNIDFIQIKIKKLPLFAKVIYVYVAIGISTFIAVFFHFLFTFNNMPAFFKIAVPIMLILVSLISFAGARQLKNYSVVLSKQDNNLYIKKTFSKNKSSEKTIRLSQDAKFVLVKFPISIFYYQLLLKNNDQIESLIPVEWDVVNKFPIIHPTMKKFLYTQDNAEEISSLTGIPLEKSENNFHKYFNNLK